jgi:uncharacterized membrane protein
MVNGPMAEQATEVILIDAPVEACFEVATRFDRYPEWVKAIKQVDVTDRDDDGRAVLVHFRTAGFGRSISYTLRYDYSQAPDVLSWVEVEGDLTSKLDGAYAFCQGDDGGTQVTYHLEAELKGPIPGFVKRRAQGLIMHTALRELKHRVEGART